MCLGSITTECRIFSAKNGSGKNAMIICVGENIQNYVINEDQLKFLKIDTKNF